MTTTWKEFKRLVEDAGVADDTDISYIDWSQGYLPRVTGHQLHDTVEVAIEDGEWVS